LQGVAIAVAVQERFSDEAGTRGVAHEGDAEVAVEDVVTFALVGGMESKRRKTTCWLSS
jgi:hypothetical protein